MNNQQARNLTPERRFFLEVDKTMNINFRGGVSP